MDSAGNPKGFDPPSALPSLADLRSSDAQINATAWARAWPLLWDDAQRALASRLLVGAQHAQDREDLAATALEQVVAGVMANDQESFNHLASFGDLLAMSRRILARRVADFFRRRGRRPEDAWAEPPEPISEERAAGADASLTRDEMERAFDQLPPPQPNIFREHFILGRTAAEIGAAHNLPRNTVLSHLHRGKIALRRWLAPTTSTANLAT